MPKTDSHQHVPHAHTSTSLPHFPARLQDAAAWRGWVLVTKAGLGFSGAAREADKQGPKPLPSGEDTQVPAQLLG